MPQLIEIGFALLFVAIILIFAGAVLQNKGDTKFVVGIFPFFVGNDERLVWLAFLISGILIVLLLLWGKVF